MRSRLGWDFSLARGCTMLRIPHQQIALICYQAKDHLGCPCGLWARFQFGVKTQHGFRLECCGNPLGGARSPDGCLDGPGPSKNPLLLKILLPQQRAEKNKGKSRSVGFKTRLTLGWLPE